MAEIDPEAALRSQLIELDNQREGAIAAADDLIGQRQGALGTAGNEYNDQVAGAESDYQDAQGDYDKFLTQLSTNLSDAQSKIDDVNTDAPSIGTVADISIVTGGTPDCSAADIQTAVNGALAEIRQMRDDIIDALSNGNPETIQGALQKLKDTGQAFRDNLPAAGDNEADKLDKYAQVNSLY